MQAKVRMDSSFRADTEDDSDDDDDFDDDTRLDQGVTTSKKGLTVSIDLSCESLLPHKHTL